MILQDSYKLRGGGLMLLWALSFSIAMALSKVLSPNIPNITMLFMRYLFGFLFFIPFVIKSEIKEFCTSRPALHLTRVIFIILAMTCTYYSYRNLPIALATSIGMTGPLFTTLLAILILKDKVSLSKWGLIFMGYLGVIVIMRPHEISNHSAIFIQFLANLFAALSINCVKLLSRTESTLTIMFYANAATTFIVGFLAYFVWILPDPKDLMILIAIGGLGVFSQFCAVTALKYSNPSFLAPFEYTRLCIAIPIGFFFFGETPTIWMLFGSIIIIGSTYGLARLEIREEA